MRNGDYWSGVLVKTGPGTYEVKYPAKRAPAKTAPRVRSQIGKAAQRKAAEQADASLAPAEKWYLSKDKRAILDGTGAVISNEVYVVKNTVVSGRRKVFFRFVYDHTVWIGYTLSTEPNRIKAKPSKGTELTTDRKRRTKKVCAKCNKTVRGKWREVCPKCLAESQKVPCANPNCKRLVCSDRKKNKTGLCRICVKQVNPYGAFVPPQPRQSRKGSTWHDSK